MTEETTPAFILGEALAHNTKALLDSLAMAGAQPLVPDLQSTIMHLFEERYVQLALPDALGEESEGRVVVREVDLRVLVRILALLTYLLQLPN